MGSNFKIFSGILIAGLLIGGLSEFLVADEPRVPVTIDELQNDPNIREVSSKRFRNLTETSKVITVYEVYGKKVAVIEAENEMEIIELNK